METMIFISHKESEQNIAKLLVDFLLSALDLSDSQIRCTSVPGHKLPFGITISEQLKKDIHASTAIIVLLTQESLRSKWVLFEVGASWALGKIIIPILGPSLTHSDLPGPLSEYTCILIDNEDAASRIRDSVTQMAITIGIKEKSGGKAQTNLDSFINAFRSWPTDEVKTHIDQAARVTIVQDLGKSISDIFKSKSAIIQKSDVAEFEKMELRFVLDNVPPWKFIPDDNAPSVAGWPPSKSLLIEGQRHWIIRVPNAQIGFTQTQYLASQALQESLLWFRRVRKAYEAGVVIERDLVDMWRFILPYGFSGRLNYFSKYFQGVEEVSALAYVINNTLAGCCDLDMRTSLHYFQSYVTEQDREILTQTKKEKELHQKVAAMGV
jgi:hypothetical protein